MILAYERNVNGIIPEINKLYEEIRNEKNGEVKEKLEEEKWLYVFPPPFSLRPNCRVTIWVVYWNSYRNMYNRRHSLLYMFVCERYIASVEMERG